MIGWYEVIAYLINSVVVVLLVQLLTKWWPVLKEKYGFIIVFVAPIFGPIINALGTMLSNYLGYPIDLSPIVGVLAGTSAVWGHQLIHQWSKRNVDAR